MKCLLLILVIAQLPLTARGQQPLVKTGIDVLIAHDFRALKGKRVGLITNPTGVNATLTPTIDLLFAVSGITLVALFGPEHGVRGDHAAGDTVKSSVDDATGLPVFSLYGKTRKPTASMLCGIDVLVYDIQDIGCRSYTYISTLGRAMEAAAESNIPFVVLDRPNPLGGERLEGNVVEPGHESFVSPYPIPYVYGLTCGELARMLNGEGMLANRVRCSLTVISMEGWKRGMRFRDTGLPWVPTSPQVPESSTPAHLASTGMLGELGVISQGVGYTIPFQVFAAPWINPKRMADSLNALNLPGVMFRPIVFKPFYGTFKEAELRGVQVHLTDETRVNLMGIQFHFLEVHHRLYPEKDPFRLADSSRLRMFDRIAGSDQVRSLFMKRMKFEDVESYLSKDTAAFRTRMKKYLLY